MLSSVAAVFRLTTHQLFGGRRRMGTALAFFLPIGVTLLARVLLPEEAFADPGVGYAALLLGVYALVFVPFMAVYWGAAVLTDDVEGKTLVYLWTRPAGRARLMVLKFVIALGWLAVLILPSLLITYLVLSVRPGTGVTLHNLQTILWDARALALGAMAYGAFAFFLSAVIKKPLMVALLYVYTLDLFAAMLPGYLKLISVRHYVLTLTTQKKDPTDTSIPKPLLELVSDTPTTEWEAILTLLGLSAALVIAGALLLKQREFLGDDPAREK